MVAGRDGFDHRRFAFGEQTGQQHARLDLGRQHGQPIGDASQRAAAPDVDRRMAVGKRQVGAHLAQRRGDAFHGAAAERGVAHQRTVEGLSGQDAGQQAHRGTRVAAVERAIRCLQVLQSTAFDDQDAVLVFVDGHAELAQARERRLRIGGRRVVHQTRGAVGQGGQQGRPVGDGLVRGQLDDAQQASGWQDAADHGRP